MANAHVNRQVLKRDGGHEQAPTVIKESVESATAVPPRDGPTAAGTPGLKFDQPTLPLPPGSKLHDRYDIVVRQVTNLMMLHGKRASAQRVWIDVGGTT